MSRALSQMFGLDLERGHPIATSIEWLETEAKDAFEQADEGETDKALGRLTVIVADLVLYGRSRNNVS